jgi:hypothetical protein
MTSKPRPAESEETIRQLISAQPALRGAPEGRLAALRGGLRAALRRHQGSSAERREKEVRGPLFEVGGY